MVGRGGGTCYIGWLRAHTLHCMTQVTVGENEGIESALRRFKRQVSKAGIFADLKRLRHHETPMEKYKRKAQQRRRRR
jgi:small subunit ribosomal protein S21